MKNKITNVDPGSTEPKDQFDALIDGIRSEYINPEMLGLRTKTMVRHGNVKEVVLNTKYNVHRILLMHPKYRDRIYLDTFDRNEYFQDKKGRIRITDNFCTRVSIWMEKIYEISPNTNIVNECLSLVAEDNSRNPLEEFFKDKKWDGKPRLDMVLITYFGCVDDDKGLVRQYSRKFFIGAIKRALKATIDKPIKQDCVLVIYGRQGLKKSTAIRVLALKEEWFGDNPIDISNKDYVLQITGKLLYEMKELARRAKSKKEEKAFLDTMVDSLRLPYGRRRIDIPRRVSFMASTNRLDILSDSTGSRRWWPVRAGVTFGPREQIDTAGLAKNALQIWLEAKHYADLNEPHWLDDNFEIEREKSREQFAAVHPWKPEIEDYVRRRSEVTPEEIMEDVLKIPIGIRDQRKRTTVCMILTELGFKKVRKRPANETNKKTIWVK